MSACVRSLLMVNRVAMVGELGGGMCSNGEAERSCRVRWYIQKVFFDIDILRNQVFTMFPLIHFPRISIQKSPLRGAAVSLSRLSFDYFHYEKNRCCITVQLPVIILIVHLNNPKNNQFAQANITFASIRVNSEKNKNRSRIAPIPMLAGCCLPLFRL